uniref:Mannosyltransferase n=1 Tax=Caenorhabditis tropicalis TaxID=1561998 RepID=A0A1I7UG00_9PELO
MTTKKQKSNSESHERKGVKRFESTTKGSSMIEFISKSETIFLTSLLFVIRLAAATWGIINDCDEVYNYWEPLHLFLHGEGFQTWEYSPIYAIRSYFYIYLHYVPAVIFTHMGLSKITVFTLVRVALGIFCLSGELYAYRAISKNINNTTARLFIFFTMFSSGVFQASSAFVPSSFCMAFVFYILGAYLNENWSFGIFCVAFSTLVGWPFSAILGLAIIIRMVFVKRHILAFIKISFLSGLCIGLTQLIVDSYHFGKPVIAPMNIVLYNVLSGPGPSLYGEEPISFYIKNLIVNWNVAIIASGIGFILSLWPSIGRKNQKGVTEYVSPIVWITATTGLWLLIFWKTTTQRRTIFIPNISIYCIFHCTYL